MVAQYIGQVDEKVEFPPESSSGTSALSLSSMNSGCSTSSAPQFPVRHNHFSVVIKGNKTEIIILSYEDHLQVIATQIETMGTILHARKEEGVSINPTFNVSVIFGKRDEPMLVACARQLIERMSFSGSSKPLVLSLGLKDNSTVHFTDFFSIKEGKEKMEKIKPYSYSNVTQETLKGIISAVIDNGLW